MQEEMTFKELLGIVCLRWRMLLVMAVVFAFVLGGYRTYSGVQNLTDESAIEKVEETNRLERQQYESKKEMLLEEIRQLELKGEQANLYNENSLLMRIDPYNKQVAKLTFSVNADMAALAQDVPESWQIPTAVDLKAEREDRIADQYLILANGLSLSELMADTDYARSGDQYLRELISINKSEHGMLTIEALTTEYVDGIELAERIYAYCVSKQEAIGAIAGAHTAELVDSGTVTQIDLALVDTQIQAQSRPADIFLQLSTKTKELKDLTEPLELTPATPASAVKSGMKYAVLGAVVGACIGAMIAFLIETLGTSFRNGAALAQAVSSRYLGNLKPYNRKHGLDAWAETLIGEDIFSTVATEDRLPLLVANLKEAAETKHKLLITGMRAQNELEVLTSDLQRHLGNEYQLIAAANLLINAEAIQQLKNVEGVVMVEGEKTTNTERVMKVKQYLDEVKYALVGVIWG